MKLTIPQAVTQVENSLRLTGGAVLEGADLRDLREYMAAGEACSVIAERTGTRWWTYGAFHQACFVPKEPSEGGRAER